MSYAKEADKQRIANERRWAVICSRAAFSGHFDGRNWFIVRIPGAICQDFVSAVDEYIAPTKKPLDWNDVLNSVQNQNIDVLRAFIKQEDQEGKVKHE